MTTGTVTLFGGTGFLGRRVAQRALEQGWTVHVAARRQRPDLFTGLARSPVHVEVDARDAEAVRRAVSGATAVVNAVSLYVESRAASFRAIHVDAAATIAEAAKAADARLVHVSGIGVDRDSPSLYVRARALGEERVREANPDSVILRPSALFGEGDAFLSSITSLVRWLPVIPLFGSGDMRLQPVHVDDVARAVMAALEREDTTGSTFELGGPDVFTYRELIRAVAERLGKQRWLLPVPFALWRLLALMTAPLPGPPITRDQLELLRLDNVATAERTFEDLGITSDSLTRMLESIRSG